jgi:ABC-2 type transport system permease protein
MTESLKRHWQVFCTYMMYVFQFRLRTLVWFLVGSVNTAIVLVYWWATVLASGNTNFSLPEITGYYILLFTFATVLCCHVEEDIAYLDVYKGEIHGYILRPYPYLLLKFHQEIVWRLLGGVWAFVLFLLLSAGGLSLSISNDPRIWILTLISCLLGVGVSFFLQCIIGLISFWLTSIRGLLDLTDILGIVLAGFIVPLTMLPEPLKTIAYASPYASVVFTPVTILSQSPTNQEIYQLLALQVFWFIVLSLAAQKIFRAGIKHYTGVSQ